ncbi:glycosyltransferase family 4 protein [Halorubrum sp. Atlit-28R]|uniref:glycosyltransferase family 4 protein n=1 Tax=Halorubrum sp. Atlit-28R TaxID=2282129 RepID=UPI000EF20949|nr:glycosyltransferase family 4 protein [Halorubrum sp. Atlit-28R]RLM50037.1 glycosyltransferase family 1 protein [Halorubrum sp. Atlit-28R]
MRVLHFLPGNTVGGISIQTLDVSETLNDRGFENVIVTPEESGDFLEMASERGVETAKLPYFLPKHFDSARALMWNLRWLATLPASVLKIRRRFREQDSDVVHLNGLMMLQPALAAKLEGISVVWYLVSDNIYPDWLVRAVIPFVNYLADEIVLISESNREFYMQQGKDVSVIPGGIDTSQIAPREVDETAVAELKDRYGIGPDDTVVVTLAKTHPMKGQKYAVEAISRMDRDDVTYLIVGPERDKEYTDELRAMIQSHGLSDRVHITGFVDEKTTALGVADVFLLPSLGEGTPLAIMEAMAMEVPTIATSVGGVPNMLDNGDAGQLVPPSDPDSIAKAIEGYISSPGLMRRHSKRASELAETEFSIQNISDKYASVYRSLR